MPLKPWRSVVDPREDLRRGEALDTAEFAVHLDQVQAQRGNALYWQPEQFFARTYLTRNLLDFAAEAVRRLSGQAANSSAGFNMVTQFGGGKTHALTLLYHLARGGPAAYNWFGVRQVLEKAGVASVPQARTAVFVGMRFDPRGGDDGTPRRNTPWGEIAWQLAGAEGLQLMAEKDQSGEVPGGDTLEKLFNLVDGPILILMDEILNYVSRYRNSGLGGQMYNFINNILEEARSHPNVVVAVSLPFSEGEMTTDDWGDFTRLNKMLDRLSKAIMVSAETDMAEIVRRRLFEWDERAVDNFGRVLLPRDATATCTAYAQWVQEHRQLLPGWFPIDRAEDAFRSTYPFHPTLLSVFERKWQALPNFQRTRGVLRLLAMWVAKAHQDAYRGAQRDPLIGLGSAPLDDPSFRAAVFKQLNEDGLETPVTVDICGTANSHATRLDTEASEAIRKARLHRQVATTIFFESNGGMIKAHATIPEIRLAVGQPDLDIGNVETVMEALAPPDGACFYLEVLNNRYWFSMRPNLTRLLSDRKAAVSGDPRIDDYVRAEILKQFGRVNGVNRVDFPTESSRIANQPALSLVIMAPEQSMQDRDATLALLDRWTREYGTSARTFKSAVIWAVADEPSKLREVAQKLLAWESIADDQDALQLSKSQQEQLRRNLGRAQADLKEAVWQSYNRVFLLDRDNKLRPVVYGPTNSSAANGIMTLVLRELRTHGEVEESISPNFLARNWPPAFTEWSTQAARNAFFASPQFPRLLDGSVLKDTVARGVSNGILAYVGKTAAGTYQPFYFRQPLDRSDVEITEDMYVVTAEVAEAYLRDQGEMEPPVFAREAQFPTVPSARIGEPRETYQVGVTAVEGVQTATPEAQSVPPGDVTSAATVGATALTWTGEVPAQLWVNFYMKVLTRFAASNEMKLILRVDVIGGQGVSQQKAEEMRAALRELGLDDRVVIS